MNIKKALNKPVLTFETPLALAQAGVWKQIQIRVWHIALTLLIAVGVLTGMAIAKNNQPAAFTQHLYTMSEISNSGWAGNLVAAEGAEVVNGVMEMEVVSDLDLGPVFVDFGGIADVFEIDPESATIWFAQEAPSPIPDGTIEVQAPGDYHTPGTYISGLTRRQ